MLDTYKDQYNFSNKAVLTSIDKGNNIVLYGSGCNGKSFLVNEVMDELIRNEYYIIPYPTKNCTSFNFHNHLESLGIDKWIVCINEKDIIFTTLSEQSYTFINMDKFRYPQYTTLRSGRYYN